jgi:hypothetical protein
VHEALVNARNRRFYHELLNVRPDSVDDRDRIYRPGLVEIKTRLNAPGLFIPEEGETRALRRIRRRLIRRQGGEGSCTGQALAAVIDIQNLIRSIGNREATLTKLSQDASALLANWLEQRVSPRMLYEMARSLDEDPEDRIVGSTLRNAIKAFGQNGVCPETAAPYVSGEVGWSLTVNQAKAARKTGLGAYYRLNANLYDYHAALNEVGAIYVSAMIHDGWHMERTDAPASPIAYAENSVRPINYTMAQRHNLAGGHAFAIIGYDEAGFLVLNSWGHGWGVWNDPDSNLPKGLPGIAHWSYEDWQDNVLDAWVFRLTVPSPKVFHMKGGYGKGIDPITGKRYNKAPRFVVNGHYINLKDGKFVRTGRLPNTEAVFKATRDLLANRSKKGGVDTSKRRYLNVLIGVNNGFEPISQGIHLAASITQALKKQYVYPLFIYWNYALLAQIENLIAASLPELKKRSGSSPANLARGIERYIRDYRFFFWDRLVEKVDKTAGANNLVSEEIHTLDIYKALMPIIQMAVEIPEMRLHFIAHSDGVLVLNRLLKHLSACTCTSEQAQALFAETCHSITIIAPLCRRSDMQGIEDIARAWRSHGFARRIGLVTLSHADELNDRTGAYMGTFPYLAQNVFFPKGRRTDEELICGLHDNAARLNSSPYYAHSVCPEVGIDSLRSHFGMTRNPELLNNLFNRMLDQENAAAQKIISPAGLFANR